MASLGLGKTMEGVRKLATIECSSDVPFPPKNSETMGLKSFVQNLPSWKMFTHRHTHDIGGSSVHFFSALNNWLTGLVRFKTLSWLNSRSENDLCSCEATCKRKKNWGFNRIWTHDLRDTSAMLYQLSYETLLEAGQERVQFPPVIWREWDDVHMI